MAVVAQSTTLPSGKIYATIPANSGRAPDRDTILRELSELTRRGGITDRDERILEYLRELHVLSLDQVHRLFWSGAKQITAYQRLHHLQKHHLLAAARVPRAGMQAWGLPVCKVYTLGEGGRVWLKDEVTGQRAAYLRRDQVLHDLLVAEVVVRLAEAARGRGDGWSLAWSGEQAASFNERGGDVPLARPDGLAVVRQRRGGKVAAMPLFVELDASREAHGRPSSDWGRKIIGYDRFYESEWQMHPELSNLPTFPVVAVVTHGDARLLNLAAAITEHRRDPVAYYLALWEDLVANGNGTGDIDILAVPAWLVVTPDGQIIGEDRARRQSLLGEPRKKRTGRKSG
jgi:DNA-binding PadR family transcriptional regulator